MRLSQVFNEMPGSQRTKPWLRRVLSPFRPSVAVLLYHRIYEPEKDPWSLSVTPANFEAHLKCLRDNYHVYSLAEMAMQLSEKRLPKRGIVITFDDGYVDNYLNAKPLLEKYQLPATIFVTTGMIDSGREFWWDSLERALLLDASVPASLQVQIDEKQQYRWPTTSPSEREKAFWELHPILQALLPQKRDQVMAMILEWADIDNIGRSDYRPMTCSELNELRESPYVEIGGHTVTHSSLSDLSADDQLYEMEEGRSALEQLLDTKLRSLAYPYGRYNSETLDMAAKAGFELAFTVEAKLVNKRKNPLRLGRFGVENWDGAEFHRELDMFFRS